ARASGPYVDAVSTNLNAHWSDGTFARFYLPTLHALAARPIMVGEFYLCAMENRSGNTNDSSGFPTVATQRERAQGFRTTLSALMCDRSVIGADWFQYYDEPTFGRDDGENYDMGLVDIDDRPYRELTSAAASLAGQLSECPPRLDASGGVPPAPPEPMVELRLMEILKRWDRERGFVKPASPNPLADLYVCWDPDAVYLGLCAHDFPEDTYYRDKQIPEVDRMEWTVRLSGRAEPLRVRLGADRPPAVSGHGFTVVGPSHASVRTA